MSKNEIIEIMKDNDINIEYENIENRTFEELGIDSVDLMMVIFGIKTKYNIDLAPDKNITIQQMVDRINENLKQ